MRYKLVYFFGPDGTGKTTQAELVSFYLRRKGVRALRATVKQHHTLSYVLLRLLRSDKNDYLLTNYFGFDAAINTRIRMPWKLLELVSVMPAIAYRVLLPTLMGFTVVLDRYVIDTLVVLSYFLHDQGLLFGYTARLLIRLIPKKALLIHLDADTGRILSRKKDEPLTEEIVNYYRSAYRSIVLAFGLSVTTIDTTNSSIENIQKIIRDLIEA
jgi:thymidylate kinase